MRKSFASDYLSFTKKERRATIVLLLLIVLLTIIPFLFPLFIREKPTDATLFKKEIDMLAAKQADSSQRFSSQKNDADDYQNYRQPDEKNYYTKKDKGELFYFDPNTVDEKGWRRLGIRDKTIATIQNYVAKGGRFYKPEDIGKIWGLHKEDVQRLLPFVQIENSYANNYAEKKFHENPTYVASIIDINSADTTVLIALPGIGSKLSQRIISFREKLGGFYSVEQIGETYGLPDSTFQKIKPRFSIDNSFIRHININTASLDEMKVHPYLRYSVANAIVQYRMQHGSYAAIDDIKKIMLVTDDIFNKAAPYLKVD
jgi:competence ComEA-like helix-hairpin-helix protein